METTNASTRRYGLLGAVGASVLLHACLLAGLACWPEETRRGRDPAAGPVSVGFVTLVERGGGGRDPLLAGTPGATFDSPWASDLASSIQKAPPPQPTGLGTPVPGGTPANAPSGPDPAGSREGTGRGTGGKAGAATTRFFGVEARGRRILYLLDASASMGRHGAWRPACRELMASLRRLPADAAFQVWTYNRNLRALLPGRPGWSPAESAHLAEVEAALADLQAEGVTNHLPALRQVLAQGPEAVFLLTDADDLPRGSLESLRPGPGAAPVVHVLEIVAAGRTPQAGELRDLAAAWRGTHRFLPLDSLRHREAPGPLGAFLNFREGDREDVGEP